jgi:hypothetical protein
MGTVGSSLAGERFTTLAAMHVFLDFEASSLGDDSYPIEVGWAAEDGSAEAHLIKPAASWTDWDPAAEAVHRIPREELQRLGEPHGRVARRMLEVLGEHKLFASAPSWDGKWMSVLLRAAGLPRHALRLKGSDEAHRGAAREILRGHVPGDKLEAIAADILKTVRRCIAAGPPPHRALPDAQIELDVWREVRRRSVEEVRNLGRNHE